MSTCSHTPELKFVRLPFSLHFTLSSSPCSRKCSRKTLMYQRFHPPLTHQFYHFPPQKHPQSLVALRLNRNHLSRTPYFTLLNHPSTLDTSTFIPLFTLVLTRTLFSHIENNFSDHLPGANFSSKIKK